MRMSDHDSIIQSWQRPWGFERKFLTIYFCILPWFKRNSAVLFFFWITSKGLVSSALVFWSAEHREVGEELKYDTLTNYKELWPNSDGLNGRAGPLTFVCKSFAWAVCEISNFLTPHSAWEGLSEVWESASLAITINLSDAERAQKRTWRNTGAGFYFLVAQTLLRNWSNPKFLHGSIALLSSYPSLVGLLSSDWCFLEMLSKAQHSENLRVVVLNLGWIL